MRQSKKQMAALKAMKLREGVFHVTLPGNIVVPSIGNYGADKNAICKRMLKLITLSGENIQTTSFSPQFKLKAAIELPEGVCFTALATVRLDIPVVLPCCHLSLRNVDQWLQSATIFITSDPTFSWEYITVFWLKDSKSGRS